MTGMALSSVPAHLFTFFLRFDTLNPNRPLILMLNLVRCL